MDDRALLEAAAKAAGYEAIRQTKFSADCWMALTEGDWTPWNPLTEDGDALRLAVKLRMRVWFESEQNAEWVVANASGYGADERIKSFDGSPGSAEFATRRAIVMAAASIGAADGEKT